MERTRMRMHADTSASSPSYISYSQQTPNSIDYQTIHPKYFCKGQSGLQESMLFQTFDLLLFCWKSLFRFLRLDGKRTWVSERCHWRKTQWNELACSSKRRFNFTWSLNTSPHLKRKNKLQQHRNISKKNSWLKPHCFHHVQVCFHYFSLLFFWSFQMCPGQTCLRQKKALAPAVSTPTASLEAVPPDRGVSSPHNKRLAFSSWPLPPVPAVVHSHFASSFLFSPKKDLGEVGFFDVKGTNSIGCKWLRTCWL